MTYLTYTALVTIGLIAYAVIGGALHHLTSKCSDWDYDRDVIFAALWPISVPLMLIAFVLDAMLFIARRVSDALGHRSRR